MAKEKNNLKVGLLVLFAILPNVVSQFLRFEGVEMLLYGSAVVQQLVLDVLSIVQDLQGELVPSIYLFRYGFPQRPYGRDLKLFYLFCSP